MEHSGIEIKAHPSSGRKDHWVNWALQLLLVLSISYGVNVVGGLKGSIDDLNVKVATVIERTLNHEKEIDTLNKRVDRIEDRDDR